MTRNSNFIFLTFSILQTGANVMSAKGNRNIAAVNAPESYTTLKEAFSVTFEEINNFIASGKLTVNDKTINLEFFLGGDYKFVLLMLGLKGATANYACAWCKIHKDDRWKTDNDFHSFNKSPMSRSLKEIKELCKKSTDNYCCGAEPLLNIELDHVIVDELHLMLRVTDVLTKNLVYQAIDRDKKDDFDKKRGEGKGSHLKKLVSTIRSLGISFDVWEQLNADKSSSGKYDFTSLTGSNKKTLLSQLPDKLHDLLTLDSRDKVTQLWRDFNNIYIQITNMELNILPEIIADQVKEWIDLFCSCRNVAEGYERARVTPYMHILFAHVPFFVEKYKCIKIFTGQGVEKNNDVARSVLHRKSNKWDSVGDILKQEFRQWELKHKEREKRKYEKKKYLLE
ncbi:uncharacterized protein LOC116615043 [Nematostella vectensis]|uniref:uncharacterized protein LOC116615043 n=1 Tax=Nematostella vectensis TaxID=45351 RepID=UPI002077291C|nr:uncharacterized protein LOC116615043 [Nematostella vectensis]